MFLPTELRLGSKDDYIMKRKKGILLLESMAGIFIALLSMGIFMKSYELLNESYAKISDNQNNKSIINLLNNELKYNVSFNYLDSTLNDKDIIIYSDDSFIEKIYSYDFLTLINNKDLLCHKTTTEEEYLSNYKNLIIKISKAHNFHECITLKIKILRKGCEKEEEIIKSSWMDEV